MIRAAYCLIRQSVSGEYWVRIRWSFTLCLLLVFLFILHRFSPRYHHHITCQKDGVAKDVSCISGEGRCIENIKYQRILYDKNNVGVLKMHLWRQVHIPLTAGCFLSNY